MKREKISVGHYHDAIDDDDDDDDEEGGIENIYHDNDHADLYLDLPSHDLSSNISEKMISVGHYHALST